MFVRVAQRLILSAENAEVCRAMRGEVLALVDPGAH